MSNRQQRIPGIFWEQQFTTAYQKIKGNRLYGLAGDALHSPAADSEAQHRAMRTFSNLRPPKKLPRRQVQQVGR